MQQIADWISYDQNGVADWFDPKRMFGVREGFDIVLGNPPYIQLQKNGGRLANRYQNAGFEVFSRMGDIYQLFYEKGAESLVDGGLLCYITSNKWMRAGYGQKLRRFFTNKTPLKLLDFGGIKVFNATVDPNIMLLRNTKNKNVSAGFQAIHIKDNFKLGDDIHARLKAQGITMIAPSRRCYLDDCRLSDTED